MSRRHSWSLLFLGPVLFGLTPSTPAQEPDHVPHWHYAWRLERDTVLHPDVRTAIDMGIEWIVNNQDDDGRWSSVKFGGTRGYDVGITGLALQVLLADGNTHRVGERREEVARGIEWLRTQQGENGLIGTNNRNDFVYCHLTASLAIVEAVAMSGDLELRKAAQLAVNYVEAHRNPYNVWRYQPRNNQNDTSVTGWAVAVLEAAGHASLTINPNALALSKTWFDVCTDPETARTGYDKRDTRSSRTQDNWQTFPPHKSESLTAISLASLIALGQSPEDHPYLGRQGDLLLKLPPSSDHAERDLYYWYYGSKGMWRLDGHYWKAWSKALHSALLNQQVTDGDSAGSWPHDCAWGAHGGRVYSTAMATLSLLTQRAIARSPIPTSSRFDAARKAWNAEDLPGLSKALAKLHKATLAPAETRGLATVQQAFERRLAGFDAEIQALLERKDYGAVTEELRRIQKQCVGLPPGDLAKQKLADFKKSFEVKKGIRAEKELARILVRRKAKKLSAAQIDKQLKDLIRRFPGTYAAEQAERFRKK